MLSLTRANDDLSNPAPANVFPPEKTWYSTAIHDVEIVVRPTSDFGM